MCPSPPKAAGRVITTEPRRRRVSRFPHPLAAAGTHGRQPHQQPAPTNHQAAPRIPSPGGGGAAPRHHHHHRNNNTSTSAPTGGRLLPPEGGSMDRKHYIIPSTKRERLAGWRCDPHPARILAFRPEWYPTAHHHARVTATCDCKHFSPTRPLTSQGGGPA